MTLEFELSVIPPACNNNEGILQKFEDQLSTDPDIERQINRCPECEMVVRCERKDSNRAIVEFTQPAKCKQNGQGILGKLRAFSKKRKQRSRSPGGTRFPDLP
jgi:hypothetical protein